MRNTGILVLLVGVFIVINSGSFRDVVLGKAKFNFIQPASSGTASSKTTASVPTGGGDTSAGQTHQQISSSGANKGGV